MKRFLVLLSVLALCGVIAEAGTIPITGTISLSNGTRLNGRLRMTLSYSAARDTTNNNIIVAQVVEWPVTNGTLPSTAQITPNDVLQPGNTYYTAEYINALGSTVGRNAYRITGSSFNIGQATPTPVTTSNLSFTDFTGLTNVTTKKLNEIRFCDQFTGATAGAKIAACIADLPSTGGIADARGFTGTQTISQNVFSGITKPVQLLIGYATFNTSVTQTPTNGSSIIGMKADRSKFVATAATPLFDLYSTGSTPGTANPALIAELPFFVRSVGFDCNATGTIGMRVTNIAEFWLEDAFFNTCQTYGMDVVGSLIFNVYRSSFLNNVTALHITGSANEVSFRDSRIRGSTTYGVHIQGGGTAIFDNIDAETNGTAGNPATGAFLVTNLCAGTGIDVGFVMRDSWLEGNKGHADIELGGSSGPCRHEISNTISLLGTRTYGLKAAEGPNNSFIVENSSFRNATTADIFTNNAITRGLILNSACTTLSIEYRKTSVWPTPCGAQAGTIRVNSTNVANFANLNVVGSTDKQAGIAVMNSAGTSGWSIVRDIADNGTNDLSFFSVAAGTTRMNITDAGIVRINSTRTSAKFIVESPIETTLTGAQFVSTEALTGGSYIVFTNSAGDTAGSITHNGTTTVAYNTSSDRNLKENIVPTVIGLDALLKIPVTDYNFIVEPGHRQQGLIAQDLVLVYPEAVSPPKDGLPWQIDYGRLTPLLIRAIQQLEARVKALEARVP